MSLQIKKSEIKKDNSQQLLDKTYKKLLNFDINHFDLKTLIKESSKQMKDLRFLEENLTNPIFHNNLSFTTLEDMIIISNIIIKANHSQDSIRMREYRLLKEIYGDLDSYLAMEFEAKRRFLAKKFNGGRGERIKISIKEKEYLDKLDSLDRKLTKISKKINIE